jgi:hypothetical protein
MSDFPPPTDTSEELILANMGLAHDQANLWHAKTGAPLEELEQIARLALVKACRKYDPTLLNPRNGRPYALSSYVCPVIRGDILHWFRDEGYAIRFPSKWREAWGKVRRMVNEKTPEADIAKAVKMPVTELREMILAMAGTACLDGIHGADGVEPPEYELNRVEPLLAITRRAWAAMHHGDCGAILAWWESPRKRAYPQLAIRQFHGHLKRILGGRRLSQVLQLSLAVAIEPLAEPVRAQRSAPRRRRNREPAPGQIALATAET